MLERYETAHAEQERTRAQLQLAILGQVLEGATTLSASDVEQSLGIPLEAEHLAVAVRVERSAVEETLAGDLRRAGGALAVIPHRHSAGTWLVWLARLDGFDAKQLAAVTAVLQASGLRCGLGVNARGWAGLTSTGREALEASRLQERLGDSAPRVVSFDELRLESLLLADPAAAARFVRAELRALDSDDARSATLRDTAQTWLTCGSNVATAQALLVHEHTVRNRIATIQELIGRPLTARRTELLVALRLRRLLDAGTSATP